ncbi:hypothetical protein C8R46DRAFT_1296916 [Mycena filopes]|nr:hypothetical protein C8R46DRAFT_1296916 [Mycena filopes]
MTTSSPHVQQSLLVGAHLLCSGREWVWDAYDGHRLIFFPDGTGEIFSRAALVNMLIAGMEWKVLPGSSDQSYDWGGHYVQPNDGPLLYRILGKLEPEPRLAKPTRLFQGILEITINRTRPLLYGNAASYRLSESVLFDTAFDSPRQIPFFIERGEFYLPWNYAAPMRRDVFQLRLTFHTSPFPVKESWRPEEFHTVEWMKLLEVTQLCARKLPKRNYEEGRTDCIVM